MLRIMGSVFVLFFRRNGPSDGLHGCYPPITTQRLGSGAGDMISARKMEVCVLYVYGGVEGVAMKAALAPTCGLSGTRSLRSF